jgi:hypothetical protein
MKHLKTFENFSINEEFDVINKIKSYILDKLKKYSSSKIEGIKSDLVRFAKDYNLSLEDLKDKNKVEMALLESNENFSNQSFGPPQKEETPEEQERRRKSDAEMVLNHPVITKLSRYVLLSSIISLVIEFASLFIFKDNGLSQNTWVATVAATVIAMAFGFVFAGGGYSEEEAKKILRK